MRNTLLFSCLAAAVLLAACGKARQSAGESAAAPAAKSALPIVGKAPDFRITTLDGKEVTAAGLKGKVVVVDFWATWCGPCVAEIPGYVALQKKYGQDLVIIGVSVDRGGSEKVKQFAQKNGMNYLVAMGDGALAESFGGFDAIPTTFLIDRDGNIRHQKTGSMAHEEYEALVKQVL
ncbi:MAG TPA: TlpA disulfide reductase family protein [Acidobacteriota bacterium]|nr:TlpA disulfide reductase family protein [Acidobacteriota bacterium]